MARPLMQDLAQRTSAASVALTCGGIVDILPRERCLNEIGPALVKMRQDLVQLFGGPQQTGKNPP